MPEKKKQNILNIDWELENYRYSQKFLLDNKVSFTEDVFFKNDLLIKPDYLYKFYGKNENNLHALLEGYLYFSSPNRFNDPFDCLSNRDELLKQKGANLSVHRNNIGVCAFSLIKENPLMWGHYTNSYNGFCLKFKNQSILDNEHIYIKRHVSYLKDYKPGIENLKKDLSWLNDSKIKGKDFIRNYLIMSFEYSWKYYDWKYEEEYRAISIVSGLFNRKLKYDKASVEEIYIGHRMKSNHPTYYKLLLHILKYEYPHIMAFEVKPDSLVVKLDFEKIDF